MHSILFAIVQPCMLHLTDDCHVSALRQQPCGAHLVSASQLPRRQQTRAAAAEVSSVAAAADRMPLASSTANAAWPPAHSCFAASTRHAMRSTWLALRNIHRVAGIALQP